MSGDSNIETGNIGAGAYGVESAKPSSVAGDLKRASRHAEPPSRKAFDKKVAEGLERREENLREAPTSKLEELSERNPLAETILKERQNATLETVKDTLSAEQQRNLVETGQGPLIPRAVAQVIKDQGLSLDQARIGLLKIYPEAQVNDTLSQVERLLKAEGHQVPPDNAELTQEEVAETPDVQALAAREDVKALADEAREALKNPAGMSDDEKESWMRRVGEIFGSKTGKVLGKAVKYTTVGVGIFAIILVFLMVMHTGGKK